jgi:hypothetical protein
LNAFIHDLQKFKEYVHRFGAVLDHDFEEAEQDLQRLAEEEPVEELESQVDLLQKQFNSLVAEYERSYASRIQKLSEFEGLNPDDFKPITIDAKQLHIRLSKDSRGLEEQLKKVNCTDTGAC